MGMGMGMGMSMTTAIRTSDTVQAPKAVIARPKAVAIHGFMDCRVAVAPRSDGTRELRSDGTFSRRSDEIGAPHA